MSVKEVEKQAFDFHNTGFHCAEAVSMAVLNYFSDGPHPDIPMAATGFGAGIGRSFDDTCGALTGGVLAVGCLFGRSQAGEDWTEAAELVSRFRREFIEEFGSSACSEILKTLGPQDNANKCKMLSRKTAGILAALIEQKAAAGKEATA